MRNARTHVFRYDCDKKNMQMYATSTPCYTVLPKDAHDIYAFHAGTNPTGMLGTTKRSI